MGFLTTAIEEYEDITGYPLSQYLSDFNTFAQSDATEIVNYYGGLVRVPYAPAFASLRKLLKASDRVNEITASFRDKFSRTDFWELLILLEGIRGKLWTIDNASRWSRSSITKNNFSPTQEIDYTQNARQTLEQIASDIAGSEDRDTDWVRIALRNDLTEEDYTPEGGAVIKLTTEQAGPSVETVVDNLIGENIYGKDIYRKLTYVDSDLQVLTPKETIKQAVDINSQLRQGDNPEFPEDGIAKALVVGSNYASFTYSALFRQMFSTFQKDDTLKNFKLTKVEPRQDALFLEFEVETRMGEFLVQSITI